MSEYSIISTSVKGDFDVSAATGQVLFSVMYTSWFSGEATTLIGADSYRIRPGNFWQSRFEVLKNELLIGTIIFNWKGEMIISYTANGSEKEFLFQYRGVWKLRFRLADEEGGDILLMEASWSKLKYHYDVMVQQKQLPGSQLNELLFISGYAANLYLTNMVSGVA